MADMSSAPRDGTRILIKHYTYSYVSHLVRMMKDGGTKISECRFHQGDWRAWCGTPFTSSTEYIDPISWAPVPDELQGD